MANITSPLVSRSVLDYNTEESTILETMLHDIVEDTPILLQHLEAVFSKEIAEAVNLVTHLQSIKGSIYKVNFSEEENLQMLARTSNRGALYVKLADRIHNMRTIHGHRVVAKQKIIAQETLSFFVPLGEQVGLQEAAAELKERSLEVLLNTAKIQPGRQALSYEI